MTTTDILAAILAAHTTVLVLLAVALVRTREKLTRLEEWARIAEKRLNGQHRQDR